MLMTRFRLRTAGVAARPAARSAGFTLVEILVSAALLSIALVAIVAIIRKAWDIETDNLHRRQARTVIVNQLESQKYDYAGYTDLYNAYKTCASPCSMTDSTVTLDPRGSNPFTGTLKRKFTYNTSLSIGSVTNIPRIIVTMTVTWNEPGYADSVSIEKWLSPTL